MNKKDKDELLDEILSDAIDIEQSEGISDIVNVPSDDFVRLRPPAKLEADVPAVSEKKELIHGDDDLDEDAKYVRENLHHVIEQNQKAIKDLLGFATQSQSPRAYEVLAQLIKTMKESNEALLDLHKKKNKIEDGSGNSSGPKTVTNNAIFLGSTAELDEMLSDHIKKAITVNAEPTDKE